MRPYTRAATSGSTRITGSRAGVIVQPLRILVRVCLAVDLGGQQPLVERLLQ